MNYLPDGRTKMTGSSGETRQKRAERICIWHVIRTPVCRREYAEYDGTPHEGHQEIFGRHDWYYSDAYRTIANIAMDWLWFGRDPWQQEIAGKLQSFYCEKQSGHWDGVFLTDGTLLERAGAAPGCGDSGKCRGFAGCEGRKCKGVHQKVLGDAASDRGTPLLRQFPVSVCHAGTVRELSYLLNKVRS